MVAIRLRRRYHAGMINLPRILVTGATGFIGRHVVQALQGSAQVVPATIDARRADLLDPGARRDLIRSAKAEILIHLAWVTEHGRFWSSPLNTEWQTASIDLFRTFLDGGGRRIVATGSCAEYDWTTGAASFAEDAPLAPHTPYGAAKLRTSQELARIAQDWAWPRIFFSFGTGEPPNRLVPLMLRAVRDATPLDIGPGATLRDFMAVQDLGAAIAAVALSDLKGPVNTASGRATAFADLAGMIECIAGTQGLIHPDRRLLGAGEPQALVADTSLLHRRTDFRAAHPLKTALAAYLRNLKDTPQP